MAVAAVLITISFRGDSVFQRAEELARISATGVSDFASAVFSPLSGAWNAALDYDDLERENRELKAELEELRQADFGARAAADDLERIYRDLDLTQPQEIPQVFAQVLVPVGNFESDLIQISKGSRDGLEVGMPVVVSTGLVGRIADVRDSRAFVRVLTTAGFVVGVRFSGSDQVLPAMSEGIGNVLVARQDLEFDPPPVGTLAVTSGLERSVYPPNLSVGEVTAVELDESTLTNVITITPGVNIEVLSFVAVLLYQTELEG